MFEQFPFYHGRYFSYSQYFQFMSLIFWVLLGVVFMLLRMLMVMIFKLNGDHIEEQSNWAKRLRDSRKIMASIENTTTSDLMSHELEEEQELKELDVTSSELKDDNEIETEKAQKVSSHQANLDAFQKRANIQASKAYGGECKRINSLIKKLEPKIEPTCGFSTGVLLARLFNLCAYLVWGFLPIYLGGFGYMSNQFSLALAMLIFFKYIVTERAFLIPVQADASEKANGSVVRWFGTFNELELENYCCILLFALISLLLITGFSKSCVTFDSSMIGIPFNVPSLGWEMSFTTAYLMNSKGKRFKCYGFQGPCHFYITLDHDAARSAYANMHLPYNITKSHVEVYYDTTVNYLTNGYAAKNATLMRYIKGDYRNFASYRMTKLTPQTDYQVVLKIQQAKMSSKRKAKTANFTVLNYQLPDHLNLPLNFRTLGSGIINGDTNMVFISNMGTSKLAEQFWTDNSNIENIDLIAFNGNVALDSGEFNCLCLWDELFTNLRTYWFRRGKIIPIFMGIGDMDLGYNYGSKNKFFGGQHSSNGKEQAPIRAMFPQAMVGPVDTYAKYGASVLKLWNNSPKATAQKKIYIISLDPGITKPPSAVDSKRIFRGIVPEDIVIIMWSAAMHPGCKYSKWMYDLKAATNEWKVFFDQYADVVVEGGGQFKALKRYMDVNNMNEKVTNTVYIGDSWISGNPPDIPFEGDESACMVEDFNNDEIDKYRYHPFPNKKIPHAWYLTISTSTLQGVAKLNGSTVYDHFSIKI